MYSFIHPFLLDGYREIHGREKSGKRLANVKTNPAETWFCWSTISKLVVSRGTSMTYKKDCYSKPMRIIILFIETEIFTEDVQKLLTDDEFSRFQFFLALNPDYGEVIPETGGLRKVRWVSGGKVNVLMSGLFTFIRLNIMRSDYCLFIVRVLKMICLPRKKQCSGC